jgi:hypothetical protein
MRKTWPDLAAAHYDIDIKAVQQPIKDRSEWRRVSSGMADVFSVIETWMPRACGYTVLWRRQDEIVAGTAGPWHHAINAMLDEDEDEDADGDSTSHSKPAAGVSRKRPRRSSNATMAAPAASGTAARQSSDRRGRRLRKSARGSRDLG